MSVSPITPAAAPLWPASVLIYSAGETIGDGLFKIPFLRQLRARFPEARITWLAGIGPTTYATTLAPAVGGLLDEVIPSGGVGTTARHLLPFQRPLPDRRFDLILDTQRSVFRTMVLKRIRHDRFVAGTAGFLFSDVRPPKGQPLPRPLLERFEVMLDLVSEPPSTPPAPGLDIDPAYREIATAQLPEGPVYIGISPGAGDRAKVWPLDRFIEVARAQSAAGRTPVFLLGPDEREWLDRLRRDVPGALFPEWGRTDDRPEIKGPVLVIALAERLTAAVANDSGTGHMLAAGGCPLVSLFSKHDPAKYAPHARRLEIVDSKDRGGTDPALIPTGDVLDALDRLLA